MNLLNLLQFQIILRSFKIEIKKSLNNNF